jgi:hypothetical protein
MSLFRRRRKQTDASGLFAATLFVVWKEIDERCVRFYWPTVNIDVAERISEHYEGYVSLLIRLFFAQLLQTGALKADTMIYHEGQFEAAWNSGLRTALKNRARDEDSQTKSLDRCLAAIEDYSLAYEKHRAEPHGETTTRYFSACQHFVDLVVVNLRSRIHQSTLTYFTLLTICTD